MYATGIGSLPGTDLPGALRHVLGAFEHAWLPELPARGVGADMVGRTVAMTEGLGFDLQPAGWRMLERSGMDHGRARGLLRRDLDDLEEAAQGFSGSVTLTMAGPWTLAATVERSRGDKVLADHGARRELAQSLAAGASGLVAEMQRRLPGVTWSVRLDEPLLPAVLSGAVATASGFSRMRAVDRPEASAVLSVVAGALSERVGQVGVHCCAPGPDLDLLSRSGITQVALDLGMLTTQDFDPIAGWLEAGRELVLGLAPTARPDVVTSPDQVVRRGLDLLRPLGLDPELVDRNIAVSTACGLAGWTLRPAIRQLDALLDAAPLLAEQLAR